MLEVGLNASPATAPKYSKAPLWSTSELAALDRRRGARWGDATLLVIGRLLVATADDGRARWSLGVVRATAAHRRQSSNRDGKTGLSKAGSDAIVWLFRDAQMVENVLLSADDETCEAIMSPPSGQRRINELFRRVTNRRISRAVVATVAQQKDYMKRVRENGGARSALAPEGYIIPGGDYKSHRAIAEALGIVVPGEGEFVSVRVVPACEGEAGAVWMGARWWRAAAPGESVTDTAPMLPKGSGRP